MEVIDESVKEELLDVEEFLANTNEVNIDDIIFTAGEGASNLFNSDLYPVSAEDLSTPTLWNINTEQNDDLLKLSSDVDIKVETLPLSDQDNKDELELHDDIEIKEEPLLPTTHHCEAHSSHVTQSDSASTSNRSTSPVKRPKSKLVKTNAIKKMTKTEENIAKEDFRTKPQIIEKYIPLQINKTKCNLNSAYNTSKDTKTTETKTEIEDNASTVRNVAKHLQFDSLINEANSFDINEASLKYLYCNDCTYKTLSKGCLVKHMKNHYGSDNIKNGLQRHLPVPSEKNGNSEILSEKLYFCNNCSHKSTSSKILKYHLLNNPEAESNSIHVCIVNGDLTGHSNIHNGEKPCSCNTCGNNVLQKKYLNTHLLTHSRDKPYSCNRCGKKFTDKNTLKTHSLTHKGEKLHSCNICAKKFKDKSNFNNHLLTHSGVKPHSCHICAKAFTRKCNLNDHLLRHRGEKPYSCNVCAKKFTRKLNLKDHLLTHSGEKPHTCNICAKKFTQKTCLKRHLLTHSEVKPHSCNICAKNFIQKCGLKDHLLTHSGEKPYSCKICAKKFTRKSTLRIHLLTHSGEKPHSCNLCTMKFTQEYYLKKHLLTHSEDKSCDKCPYKTRHLSYLERHLLIHLRP